MRPLRVLALSLAAALLLPLASLPPAFATLPGGAGRIAFETGRSDEFDIWSMNPNGSSKKRLTTSAAEDHSPAWAYAGIVFSQNPIGGGNGDIWRMNFDGSHKVRLTSTPDISETDPAWSPDAEVPLSAIRVVFASSKTGGGDLYTVRASDGGNLTRITSSKKPDFQPDWSIGNSTFPHGRIAFVSTRSGNADIYVMKPDGTGLKRLTFNTASDSQPTWDPDAKRIAFVSDRDGDNEIFVMNADGTHLKQITHNGANDQGPVWSPECGPGSTTCRIAFMSNRDASSFEIYTMKPDGSNVLRLTHDGFVDGFPTWEPLAG